MSLCRISNELQPIIDEMKRHDGGLSLATRERLAYEAFQQTANYDATVSGYLSALMPSKPEGSSSACASSIYIVSKGSPHHPPDADITDDFSI